MPTEEATNSTEPNDEAKSAYDAFIANLWRLKNEDRAQREGQPDFKIKEQEVSLTQVSNTGTFSLIAKEDFYFAPQLKKLLTGLDLGERRSLVPVKQETLQKVMNVTVVYQDAIEFEAKEIDFTWEVTNVTDRQIDFKLYFNESTLVSNSEADKHSVKVEIEQSLLFYSA